MVTGSVYAVTIQGQFHILVAIEQILTVSTTLVAIGRKG